MPAQLSHNNILEEKDFLDCINRYGGIIARICYYYAESPEDFSDLRQDVLATLWESRKNFKGESSSSTWIYRVALNVSVSHMRKVRKRNVTEKHLEILPEVADEHSDKMARYTVLQRIIQHLPREDKAIILLWLDNLKYEEMAEIIGIPRNTLATRLRRIKERMALLAAEL